MDKQLILKSILAELEAELHRQQNANQQAAANATDEEARAESKWDTQGLESSYLARGYAQQFALLSTQAKSLQSLELVSYIDQPIAVGALVECDFSGETSHVFLLPCCGGVDLTLDGAEITVVTPESPLGAALLRKRAGQPFAIPGGVSGTIRRVE
ncbi:transcription elongation factor GreAB [Puniceicoccales bacterium CK1056]|uniref:Transcription elongation factor GreAB n=1 Tax=Oceanipulchritudo coccoides TaxID=2706888 RepID=A0A6B2M1C2_9BACT|nr:transcription elongation factor GreAB [Oceanipulchritudo coccoides]NDV62718.1 transcription elongation factor GreAB [Oceanipulchritudo coccoides]